MVSISIKSEIKRLKNEEISARKCGDTQSAQAFREQWKTLDCGNERLRSDQTLSPNGGDKQFVM